MSAHDTSIYAVALFPGEAGTVREVRVVALNLFGGTPDDTIGAVVREVDANGVPYAGKERESIVPIQRLVFARLDGATGRRTVPGRELAEKKAAYAERLAAGPSLNILPSLRRKPRLALEAAA
jgi:hypothetical protein